MKTWSGSYWQLAEISLFQGHCWSCMMLMMDSSSFHIIHPWLYIALVWVIRALLIKSPLISCILITVEWVENRMKVFQTKQVSKFIASVKSRMAENNSQSRVGLICVATWGLLGKIIGLGGPNVVTWRAWIFVDQRLPWGRGDCATSRASGSSLI